MPDNDERFVPPTATEQGPSWLRPAASLEVDVPSPPVTAVYLRPTQAPALATQGPPANETLIDAITRIVSGMLERDLRDSVTAAVRALAPRLVVSLPPDAGEPGSTQSTLELASSPSRRT